MMRSLLLILVVLLGLPVLGATVEGRRTPERDPGRWLEEEPAAISLDVPSFEDAFRAQVGTKKRETTKEQFGAGASLGINYAAVGLGLGFWFEYYPVPMAAVGAHMSVAYGALGSPYENGGDGLAFSLQFGGRFVVDFDSIEITRWLRPFVAFYPVGFAFFSGNEDFDVPGTGNTDEISYSDVFFLMSGGFGCDFMITPQIGLGLGLYIYGTVGGSEHEKGNFKFRTEGSVGVYFEYVRLSLRF